MQQRLFILFPNLWVDWTRLAVLTQSRLSCSCLSLGADLGRLQDSLLTSLVPGLGRQNSAGLDLLGLSVSLFLSFLYLFLLSFPFTLCSCLCLHVDCRMTGHLDILGVSQRLPEHGSQEGGCLAFPNAPPR